MADDDSDDDFGGFGADDSHDIMMPAAMTTNAMAGGRRESKVSSNIRLSRAGDTADNSALADIVAMGTSADVGDISKELRLRWEKGRIYSNVGSVLLAMNPYRNIFETKSDGTLESIYSDDIALQYYKGELALALEPHVFGVAANAYRNLITTKIPQCIVISGDSGAGKTETAKQVMHFLAVVAATKDEERGGQETQKIQAASRKSMRRLSTGPVANAAGAAPDANGSMVTSVVMQLLESNVILETFGNAETVRSFNSSRFGKYVEVMIKEGDVVGSVITSYLLEKTRVVGQSPNERNYHSFYQLLTGFSEVYAGYEAQEAPDESQEAEYDAAAFPWEDFVPEDAFKTFPYLSNGERRVPGVDDGADLGQLIVALKMFMPDTRIRQILRLLTAVLHIGTLEFDVDSVGHASVKDTGPSGALSHTCALLGVDTDSLAFAICNRQIQTGSRASIATKRLDLDAATIVRDTLAKSLYAGLFHDLIKTMNTAMKSPQHSVLTLGTLDIYGFEILGKNSLEQFLINYVNEKLQSLFIDRILGSQQEEYQLEGINWLDVEFHNNQPTCALLENKKGGILGLLDEQCAYTDLGPGQAKNFVGFLRSQCANHISFVRPGRFDSDVSFKILHYAGQVEYDATNFISSNRDELNEELVTLMITSTVPLYETLLMPEPEPEPERPVAATTTRSRRVGEGFGGSKKRAPTMAQQFKKQVLSLMETLNATEPHFIRCLKPNEDKKPDLWDEKRMHEQVVFNGIPENVRIAQAGFVWRVSWQNFIDRYKLLSPRTWPKVAEGCPPEKACVFICEDADLYDFQYVVGKRSKVFIKEHAVVDQLELKRTEALSEIIVPITKLYRGRFQRKRFLIMKKAAQTIIQRYKCRFLSISLIKKRNSMKFIQPLVRGFVARRRCNRLSSETKAAKIITTYAQGWSARHSFPAEWRDRIKAAGQAVRDRKRTELKAALFFQTWFRRYKWRKAYKNIRRSIVKIQRGRRSMVNWKILKMKSILLLQVAIRRFKARSAYVRQRNATIKIQRSGRAHMKLKLAKLNGALLLQRGLRRWRARTAFNKQKKAAIAIQRRGRKYNKLKLAKLNGALLLQRGLRRWRARTAFNKQKKAAIAIQRSGRAHMKLKLAKLNGALLLQRGLRRWRARTAFKKQKKAAIAIQRRGRKMMMLNNLKLRCAIKLQMIIRRWKARSLYKKQKISVVKIQSRARMRICRSEWRAQRKAIFFISIRIRGKLARMRMKMVKSANKLKFQLLMIEGTQVHRYLPEGIRCDTPQKIWCDPELSNFRISWRPPVKGKGNADKGGKREDEHPMRMSQITSVKSSKRDSFPLLTVNNADGRCWELSFDDMATCVIVANGLIAIAGI